MPRLNESQEVSLVQLFRQYLHTKPVVAYYLDSQNTLHVIVVEQPTDEVYEQVIDLEDSSLQVFDPIMVDVRVRPQHQQPLLIPDFFKMVDLSKTTL